MKRNGHEKEDESAFTPSSMPTVRAVERALEVLVAVGQAEGGLSIAQAHRRTGLHKATAYRLLSTLERAGFVEQDPATRRYRPGYRVLELAAALLRESDLVEVSLPELRRLRDETGETATLYVREGCDRLCVLRVESRQSVRRAGVAVGERLPLTRGAAGKVLLAFAGPHERERICEDYRTRRPQLAPVAGWEAFLQELEEIRSRGYAVSHGERDPQVRAAAAPVVCHGAPVVAAVSVSGPAARVTQGDLERMVPSILQASRRIALRLTLTNPG